MQNYCFLYVTSVLCQHIPFHPIFSLYLLNMFPDITLFKPPKYKSTKNKQTKHSPSRMAQLVGTSSHTPKCCRFNPQLGIPRLCGQSLVGMHTGANWSMILSHRCFSLSLPLSLLSQINKNISLGEDLHISISEGIQNFKGATDF